MSGMNVSFGAMIYSKEDGYYKTKKQYTVESKIDKLFQAKDKFDLADEYYKPLSLVDYIRKEALADVFVKHKKDGNIEIRLKEYPDDIISAEEDKLDENNKPIFVNLDLKKPLSTISRQINKFAQKCIEYAGNYENMVIEKENPEESFKRHQALMDLFEEERFAEEFGTNEFN